MSSPPRIHEIPCSGHPHVLVGQVVEVAREPFFVVGISHEIGDVATSRMEVVEPDRWWKVRYKVRRFFREWVRVPARRLWRTLRGER